MTKPPLQEYILGRGPGQARSALGPIVDIALVVLIAVIVRFVMIVTEVTIVSLPVIDPLLKSLYHFCEDMVREHYYY